VLGLWSRFGVLSKKVDQISGVGRVFWGGDYLTVFV